MFLLSLDEMDRVKRLAGLKTFVDMERATAVSERTWRTATKTRKPTTHVLDALAILGARADRVLVAGAANDEISPLAS